MPEDKIVKRYTKCMDIIPELVKVCDVMHMYDNSVTPFRIFKKRKNEYFFWENEFWDESGIRALVGVNLKGANLEK